MRSVGNWERGEGVPRARERRVREALGPFLAGVAGVSVETRRDLSTVSDAQLLAEIARRFDRGREGVGNDERSASTNQAGQSGTITDLIGRQAGVAEQTRRAARRGRVPANPLEHAGEEHQGEAPDEGG